jgi:long-subunit acyl-CoA synthetase (AMP-forming)
LRKLPEVIGKRVNAKDGFTVADQWEETADRRGDKPCLWFTGDEDNNFPARNLSFRQVDQMSNQVANWGLSQGLQKGDTVALFFENRPEFVATWLGMSKIGVITAWINNTIKNTPLVHSIKIANAKMCIFGIELTGEHARPFVCHPRSLLFPLHDFHLPSIRPSVHPCFRPGFCPCFFAFPSFFCPCVRRFSIASSC